MRATLRLIAALPFVLVAARAAAAEPTTFVVSGAGGQDVVSFSSKAPFETIIGRTSKVSGEIATNLDDLAKTTGTIDVDLASLDTGIAMRNDHMKSADYLDVAKHTKATFTIKSVKPAKKAIKPGDRTTAKITGDLTLHGVTKSVTTTAEIALVKGDPKSPFFQKDTLGLGTSFVLKLADYGIKRPEMLALKLAPDVAVSLTVQAALK